MITGSSTFADDDGRELVIAGDGSSVRATLDLNHSGVAAGAFS